MFLSTITRVLVNEQFSQIRFHMYRDSKSFDSFKLVNHQNRNKWSIFWHAEWFVYLTTSGFENPEPSVYSRFYFQWYISHVRETRLKYSWKKHFVISRVLMDRLFFFSRETFYVNVTQLRIRIKLFSVGIRKVHRGCVDITKNSRVLGALD